MKLNIKYLILVLVVLFSGHEVFAQLSSPHAAGIRFGSATGFTYRHSLSDVNAFEGILSVQSNSRSSRLRLVGLYQYHQPLDLGTEGFSWYWGFGGSVGSYTGKAYTDANGNRMDRYSELALSVDGVAGIEYAIPTTPLAVSLDVKPYFDFLQSSSFKILDTFGFSIRYKF